MPRQRIQYDSETYEFPDDFPKRLARTAAKQLRRKLGDAANNPTYILNEPRVGYRMEKGEERENA